MILARRGGAGKNRKCSGLLVCRTCCESLRRSVAAENMSLESFGEVQEDLRYSN